MKKGNNIYFIIISFILGIFSNYIITQFKYFKVDLEVNLVETVISLITAVVGIYIATSLNKFHTRSVNLHNYLQPKLDSIWISFTNFNSQLVSKDFIEISEIARITKEFDLNIEPLKQMFSSFNLNHECLNAIEVEIESLVKFITDNPKINPISKNIVNYSASSSEIKRRTNLVNEKFALAIKNINNIV
ncbi:MAG: hypothetical protein JNL49_05975 [Bacteroidia bacterium]|nr:hypothetical protein [Bacteroidia bacterium]